MKRTEEESNLIKARLIKIKNELAGKFLRDFAIAIYEASSQKNLKYLFDFACNISNPRVDEYFFMGLVHVERPFLAESNPIIKFILEAGEKDKDLKIDPETLKSIRVITVGLTDHRNETHEFLLQLSEKIQFGHLEYIKKAIIEICETTGIQEFEKLEKIHGTEIKEETESEKESAKKLKEFVVGEFEEIYKSTFKEFESLEEKVLIALGEDKDIPLDLMGGLNQECAIHKVDQIFPRSLMHGVDTDGKSIKKIEDEFIEIKKEESNLIKAKLIKIKNALAREFLRDFASKIYKGNYQLDIDCFSNFKTNLSGPRVDEDCLIGTIPTKRTFVEESNPIIQSILEAGEKDKDLKIHTEDLKSIRMIENRIPYYLHGGSEFLYKLSEKIQFGHLEYIKKAIIEICKKESSEESAKKLKEFVVGEFEEIYKSTFKEFESLEEKVLIALGEDKDIPLDLMDKLDAEYATCEYNQIINPLGCKCYFNMIDEEKYRCNII